jgi:tetratricopeptide (TPR) repeat protein/DNA-binding winged helix-turn-helix (wHTH) protein/TolB-like protein
VGFPSIGLAESLRFGDAFELDLRAYELRRAGSVVRLERIPMELLLLLVENRGQLVSREQILERIWGKDVFLDCDNSINAAVRKVRQALKDDPEHPRFIQTVTGKGYRFIAQVVEGGTPAREPDAAPATADGIAATVPAKTSRSAQLVIAAVAVAALAVVAGVVFQQMKSKRQSAVVAPLQVRRSVAVLGFRNLSGTHDQDWMSTALAEMISTELASGEQLRLVPGENVAQMKLDLALPETDGYSPETLSRIRKSLGTDLVVLGSYLDSTSSDGKLRLDLQVQDADRGELVAAVSETGSDRDIPDLVSRAGDTLRAKLGVVAVSPDDFPQIKASLPANPEAARFYSEGLTKLRAFDPAAARSLLEKAVAADPNHALGHSQLAAALKLAGYDAQALVEAKKALDLWHNASRPEQLLIQGQYQELNHDVAGAIQSYRTLWDFFPDDLEYGLLLASAQTKAGSAKDALDTIARLRNLPKPQGDDARIDVADSVAAESLSDFARSERVAAVAVSKAEMQGNRLVMAEALQKEGYATDHLGDLKKAMELFVRAHDLRQAAGDNLGAASALHSIAMVQYNLGDFESARKSFEDALRVFRQLGAMWDVASCSHNFAVLLQDSGDLQGSRHALEEALRIQRDMNDQRGIAADLDDLGNVMLMIGDLPQAQQMKEEAIEKFRNLDNKVGEAIAANNLGEVFLAKGDLTAAKQNFDHALQLKREAGYKKGIGYSLFDIAEILRRQDHLADARVNAEQSLADRKEIGNEVEVAESQLQLAEISLQQEKAIDAESLARSAIAVFEKHRITNGEAIAAAVLSEAFVVQGKARDAAVAAQRAVTLANESQDIGARFESELANGDVKAALHSFQAAQTILERVSREASHRGYLGYQLEADLRLGKVQIKSGNAVAGRTRLARVRKDAAAGDFSFIARQAAP